MVSRYGSQNATAEYMTTFLRGQHECEAQSYLAVWRDRQYVVGVGGNQVVRPE